MRLLLSILLISRFAFGASFDSTTQRLMELYERDFATFSKFIFDEMAFNESQNFNYSGMLTAPYERVVFNNDGYLESVNTPYDSPGSVTLIKGNPLKISPEIPIGYNIFLPKGEIRGVMVEVYGGHTKDDPNFDQPSLELRGYTRPLVRDGIAVITLNLIDRVKLDRPQMMMPEELHNELHRSIHQFANIIRNDPEQLHPELSILKGKRIILGGGSFGGRTSFRHAEIFPDDFDGYFSMSGGLSLSMVQKTQTIIFQEDPKPCALCELRKTQSERLLKNG